MLTICGSDEEEGQSGDVDAAVDEDTESPSRKCARRDEMDDGEDPLPSLQVTFRRPITSVTVAATT